MLLLLLMALDDPSAAANAELLYTQFEKMLYRVAFRQVHNKEDAEDAIIEAFLVLHKAGRLPDAADPKAAGLLAEVVKRKAIDIYNRNTRHETDLSVDDTENGVIQLQANTTDPGDSLSLKDAIRRLPQELQDVLILYYYHGLSTKEIAQIQGIKQDTVQKRIKHARELLKEQLK